MFPFFWLSHLSFYEIYNEPKIETNLDRREIETNMQSQSQAFDCTRFMSHIIRRTRGLDK